jgi:thiol-disulfide isomerase/thioredoxin
VGRAGRLSVHILGTCPRCEGRNHSFLHAPRVSVTESEILRNLSVKFLTRDGCHLCDEARPVLAKVAKSMNVSIEEVDIDSDDELTKLYGLRVPVVLGVHGRVLAEGVIDDRKLLKDALQREVDL